MAPYFQNVPTFEAWKVQTKMQVNENTQASSF
jgi:hypothetical protein